MQKEYTTYVYMRNEYIYNFFNCNPVAPNKSAIE